MADKKTGPRIYKQIPIANVVVVEPVRYMSKPEGWVMETGDFTELSYFLGYKFEPRSMYEVWSPEGVARGGHLESRSKYSTVINGAVYYAMIDMRPGEDRGKAFEFILGEANDSLGNCVLIPEGVVDFFVPINGPALTHQVGDRPYNKFDNEKTLDIFDPNLGLTLPKGTSYHSRESDEGPKPLSLENFFDSIK